MRYNRVQSIALADINPNIKPVYWTKGKQKPCNRSTYFEQVIFKVTGSKRYIDDKDVDTRWIKFCNSYNAGREVTIAIIKHDYTLIRNSAEVKYTEIIKERFTVDRKHQPITQAQLLYILNGLLVTECDCWKQANR